MSHAGQLNSGTSSAGPIDTLTPDTGGVVTPVLNNVNVFGANGIQTSNGGAGTLTITDTLVNIGTAQTIGAVTQTIVSLPLLASQSAFIQVIITGYESTTPASIGGQVLGQVFRAGAAAAAVVKFPDKFTAESNALANSDMNISTSGNNAIVTVTGQAGLTINWRAAAFFITQP